MTEIQKLTIGQQVKVAAVEGTTERKGPKQNQTYTVTEVCSVENFYYAENEKGKRVQLWLLTILSGKLKLGIQRSGQIRMSYTENFQIL